MPLPRPTPPPVASSLRHGTRLTVPIPIGGLAPCEVAFTVRHTLEDGTHYDEPDGTVTLTPQEFGALPSFGAFYAELRALAHAKRAQYD